MSAAEKYGSPVGSINAEALAQARAAGQTLADKGVTQSAAQAMPTPAHTPAARYGANSSPQRELPPPTRSR